MTGTDAVECADNEVLAGFVCASGAIEGTRCMTCVIRAKPATDSNASRPPIPTQAGHPFRSKPATLWRVVEALSRSATESPDESPFAATQGDVRCLSRECRCGKFEKS